MQINIEKRYAIAIFVGLLVLAGSWVAYAVDASGAWHSASQIDWTGFVFPAEIRAQLKGDTGPAGVAGPVGATGPQGPAGPTAPVATGLYGYCRYSMDTTGYCTCRYGTIYSPNSCSNYVCKCPSGYTLLEIGSKDGCPVYSCLKN